MTECVCDCVCLCVYVCEFVKGGFGCLKVLTEGCAFLMYKVKQNILCFLRQLKLYACSVDILKILHMTD